MPSSYHGARPSPVPGHRAAQPDRKDEAVVLDHQPRPSWIDLAGVACALVAGV
jgi:hypothetical protein